MRRALMWIVAFLPTAAFAHGVVEVQGRVLDGAGKPVADARVSSAFVAKLGSMTAADFARTDHEGRYRLRVHLHEGSAHALMAIDADEAEGGIAPIVSGALTQVDVKLRRLRTVTATLLCTDLGGPRRVELSVLRKPGGAVIVHTTGERGRVSLLLPKGSYELKARASVDHVSWRRDLTVGDEDVAVGEVLVEGAPHTKHLGLAPPAWTVKAARNLTLPDGRAPESVKEEDFDGRWLIVGFFDGRTEDGVEVLRSLAELCKQFEAKKERLAVVAFHAPWVKTFAQFDKTVGKLELPFTTFVDPSGKTYRSWGIGKEPRIVLLDPEGRLQRWDPYLLSERLGR